MLLYYPDLSLSTGKDGKGKRKGSGLDKWSYVSYTGDRRVCDRALQAVCFSGESIWNNLSRQIYLDNDQFVASSVGAPKAQKRPPAPPLEVLASTDCRFLWTPFHHCWKYCSGCEES